MAYDPDVHDITLNGVDYRVLARQRDSAPEFVAKFNTGDQGENDLDLFKSKSTDTFGGGQWQQRWKEDSVVANIINGYFNEVDEVLYPTPDHPATGISAIGASGNITQLAVFDEKLLTIADNGIYTNAQYTNAVLAQNTITTIPTAMNTVTGIASTARYDTNGGSSLLIISGDDSSPETDSWSWDGTTTISNFETTDDQYLVAFSRGTLYGLRNGGKLYFYDGSAWQETGWRAGSSRLEPLAMFDFNSRLWIAKEDGLYQWDGVQIVKVLNFENNELNNSFDKRAILQGWLYYMLDGFLMRFNGSIVEKLRDFRGYDIADICAGKDRIWIVQRGTTTWVDSGKLPYSASKTYLHVFDGVGFYTWKEYESSTGDASKIIYWNDHIVVAHNNDTITSTGEFKIWKMSDEFTDADADPMVIETSEFNAGYSNINKYLRRIEVEHINLGASDTIKVEVRTYDGETWGSYTDLGNITTTTPNYIDLSDLGADGTFLSMQIRVTLTRASGSSAGIRDLSFRYVLVPENRWRWTLTLPTNNEELTDLLDDDQNPNTLRYNIEQALESDAPVDFLDVHWTLLDEALDASETGISVNDANIFKVNDIILIDSEKMKVTAIDTGTNTLTVDRGARNTTATTHTDNTRVYINQEVYVERLINENLTPRGEQDRGDSDGTKYDSIMQIQLTEI